MLHVNLTNKKSFSQKQLLFIGVGFFAVLSCAVLKFFLLPQYREILAWQTTKVQVLQELDKVQLFCELHPQGDVYLAELDQKLIDADQKIPVDASLAEFVKTLAGLAWQQGLTLEKVMPEKSFQRQGFCEMPLEISLRGSFFSILGFLQQCESLPRLMTIHKVVFASKGLQVSCSLAISIYAYSLPAEFLQEKVGAKSSDRLAERVSSFKQ
ncbi:MAG: type 4a pilus biogenesis protein PilO [Sporomusaceae bacterium]|nr:type 4a pilus biogenesis protein PilO [Sporomusaceae bacterium]